MRRRRRCSGGVARGLRRVVLSTVVLVSECNVGMMN